MIDSGRKRRFSRIIQWRRNSGNDANPRAATDSSLIAKERARHNVSFFTRETYARIFDKHLLPRIGSMAIRDVTFPIVARMSAAMRAEGTGPAVTRKAMSIGQSIFGYALASDYLQVNPFVGVKKPSGKRKREVVVLTPDSVERLRRHLIDRGQQRDATLISVLAYQGPRPGEAMGLAWPNVRERTMLIDHAASDGKLKATKNEKSRSVALLAPVAVDLAEWRIANGRPADGFVVPNREWHAVATPRLEELDKSRLSPDRESNRRGHHTTLRSPPLVLLPPHPRRTIEPRRDRRADGRHPGNDPEHLQPRNEGGARR